MFQRERRKFSSSSLSYHRIKKKSTHSYESILENLHTECPSLNIFYPSRYRMDLRERKKNYQNEKKKTFFTTTPVLLLNCIFFSFISFFFIQFFFSILYIFIRTFFFAAMQGRNSKRRTIKEGKKKVEKGKTRRKISNPVIAFGESYSIFFPIGNEIHVDTHTHGSMVVSKNDRSQYIPEQQRTSVVFFHLYFFLFFFSPSIIVYYCYLHWTSSLL